MFFYRHRLLPLRNRSAWTPQTALKLPHTFAALGNLDCTTELARFLLVEPSLKTWISSRSCQFIASVVAAVSKKRKRTSFNVSKHHLFRTSAMSDSDRPRRSRFDQTEPEAKRTSRFDRRSRSPAQRDSRDRERSPLNQDNGAESKGPAADPAAAAGK